MAIRCFPASHEHSSEMGKMKVELEVYEPPDDLQVPVDVGG